MFKSFHNLFLKFSVSSLAIHINYDSISVWGLLGGSDGKECACSVGDLGLIPGLGRSLGEGNGYLLQYSWRISWTEEPGGLQPMRSQRVGHD